MGFYILCAYYVTNMLFNYQFFHYEQNSIDRSLDFIGLSQKCTCMNHILYSFHATHPHMIYVIHLISRHDHCLGSVTLNVVKMPFGSLLI